MCGERKREGDNAEECLKIRVLTVVCGSGNCGIYKLMRGAWLAFIREKAVILRELNR